MKDKSNINKRLVTLSIATIMCLSMMVFLPPAAADPWVDPKMVPQLPDPTGWDVYGNYPGNILADDFQCLETGPIVKVHFFGSWNGDWMPSPDGRPLGFHVSFHADIPDPDGSGPAYSMPGAVLWEQDVSNFVCTPEPPSPQGWYEPQNNFWEKPNHMQYFHYDIVFTEPYFMQTQGTIYWIDIAPVTQPGFFWGWKTSLDHFNDDAVYTTPPIPPATLLTQNFDAYTPQQYIFPPTGWSIQSSSSPSWYLYLSGTTTYARCNRIANQASNEYLISQVYDFTGQTIVYLQNYLYFYNSSSDSGGTHVYILGSTDGGSTWTQTIAHYTATVSSGTYNYDISSWAAGQSNVKIAWRFVCPSAATVYDYVYIDSVKLGSFAFPPSGWNVYNVDGGDQWVQYATYPHSGTYDASCLYDVPNNDWLVSKQIIMPSSPVNLDMWLAKGSTSYTAETCTIYYSTTGNTVNDFLNTGVQLWTGSPPTVAPTYTLYSNAIPVSAGTPVWFALRYTGNNQLRVYTDDWTFPDGSTQGFEATVYYQQNFDQNIPQSGWPPAGWTTQVVSGTDTDNYWKINDTTTYPAGVIPTSGKYMAEYDVYIISSGNSARLYTPALNFGGTGNQLSFMMYHSDYTTQYDDQVQIQVSTDGSSWTTLATFIVDDNTPDGWKNHVVSLSAYDGLPTVYVGFLGVSYYGMRNVYIDDVLITDAGSPGGWGELRDPMIHTSLDFAFVLESMPNNPPFFGTPMPVNGSINQPLSLTWSIPINDPEGDLFTWSIQCSNGQASGTSGAANGTKSLALSGLAHITTYKVWVNATDPTGSGRYTRKSYTFTTIANQPPVAGFSYTPSSPTDLDIIQFTDASTDSDGTIASWSWTFGDGGTSTLQNPTHQYADDGTYTVTLTVTDDDGASASISKNVVVSNVAPVADADGPYKCRLGETITFDGSWSYDLDGTIVSYQWTFGDGTTGTGENPTHTYADYGEYTVMLTVTDDDGATDQDSTTANVPISKDEPPTVLIVYPNGGEALKGTVTVEWFIHDTQDQNINNLPVNLYYVDASNVNHLITSTVQDKMTDEGQFAWSTTSLPDGTYRLALTAVDSDGNLGHDQTHPFTVSNHNAPPTNNPPNQPDRPSGSTNGKAGVEYTYTSSASEPDGDQIWLLFDWGDTTTSGWLGPYSSGDTVEAKHAWAEKDNYNVKVKAKDVYGKESTWSDPLPITMPYMQRPILQFLQSLLERFPNAFPVLRQLLG